MAFTPSPPKKRCFHETPPLTPPPAKRHRQDDDQPEKGLSSSSSVGELASGIVGSLARLGRGVTDFWHQIWPSSNSRSCRPMQKAFNSRGAPVALRSLGAMREEPRKIEFKDFDPQKWEFSATRYNGAFTCRGKTPELEFQCRPISEGIGRLQGQPDKYKAIMYQTDMTTWPENQQLYTLLLRSTTKITVQPSSHGAYTFMLAKYQALPKMEAIKVDPDEYTNLMTYRGRRLGPPVFPGRGQGFCDVPSISIITEADPTDVAQGRVGNCWLLSAISALSEYDGAIRKLFRKTRRLDMMPKDSFNKYTVTLWDLETWSEVDVVIDERLCTTPEGDSLLGTVPAADGELWACYLEKALAAHCGGWDAIESGTSDHAFKLLTGCKECYQFRNYGDGWECFGTRNPNTGRWERLANSPHGGFRGLWPMDWPQVGGGGNKHEKRSSDEFFKRMCAWEDANFIMCCATDRRGSSEGIVKRHAYTILACWNDVAGTSLDLIKVRNPWGWGEIKSGMWGDDGPGWNRHPDVKAALKPTIADDGIFWLSKREFFREFNKLYLCAVDMSKFAQ